MKTLDGRLSGIIGAAVEGTLNRLAAPKDIRWKPLRPTDTLRWDFSINAALTWSALSGTDARTLARLLAGSLREEPAFAACEAAEQGFVNIRLDDGTLAGAALLWDGPEELSEPALLPPGHPLAAGPPFMRRLAALAAMKACPVPKTDAAHPEVRLLLWCLVGIRAELERGRPQRAELLGELMDCFERCHRSRLVSPALCRAVLGAAGGIMNTEDEKEGSP